MRGSSVSYDVLDACWTVIVPRIGRVEGSMEVPAMNCDGSISEGNGAGDDIVKTEEEREEEFEICRKRSKTRRIYM